MKPPEKTAHLVKRLKIFRLKGREGSSPSHPIPLIWSCFKHAFLKSGINCDTLLLSAKLASHIAALLV
jgi:hypothetical protein